MSQEDQILSEKLKNNHDSESKDNEDEEEVITLNKREKSTPIADEPVKKKNNKSVENQQKKPKKKPKDGNVFSLQLDGLKKQLSINIFKGNTFVDMREYYENDEEEWKPTKKGISLPIKAWKVLKANIQKIDKVIDDLKSASP